jgi:hypothetical protein
MARARAAAKRGRVVRGGRLAGAPSRLGLALEVAVALRRTFTPALMVARAQQQ